MTTIEKLKRRQTRQLRALVRSVRSRQRLHRHVPSDEQFIAAAALSIINQRRRRK